MAHNSLGTHGESPRYGVRLPRSTGDQLEAFARATGRTISDVIRSAIEREIAPS